MLDVAGNVDIDFDGSRGRLVADGQQLVIDLDEPTALPEFLDLRSLRDLAAGLVRADLTLHMRSGDRLLILAGRDAKTGILSRLLRLPRVQLNRRFALRCALAQALGQASRNRKNIQNRKKSE